VAKHQLRNWVESRLPALSESGDEGAFERKLNAELRDAKLSCGEGAPDQPCPDAFLLGYLNDLKVRRSGVFLTLRTGVGIECGFDESAYIYSWSDEGWRRVWQNEQNTYTEKEYKPQTIHSVLISAYNRANEYVVLTLGSESWCQSTLHNVYYRAFRLGPDPEARPLVDGAEWAHIDDDPPIHGSVTVNDVLVEFTVADSAIERQAIRHYKIDHDNVTRIDPIALSPRDFVSEWLRNDWTETALWSEPANRRSTRDWHSKLNKGFGAVQTLHCPSTPDIWQVSDVHLSNPPTPIDGEPTTGIYFLVRWRPPYTFTMVQVSDRPSPDCTEEDRKADDEHRTLFPPQ
jgi:hypothetical protein